MDSEKSKESLIDQQSLQEQTKEQPHFFLFNINVPMWKYILRAGLISLVPSLIISGVFMTIGLANKGNTPQFETPKTFSGVMVLVSLFVIIGPVIETLLMAFFLWLLSFITTRKVLLAVISCIIWAGLHSLAAPVWGMIIVWPFFVFSCAYLAWQQKSRWHAIGVTSFIHIFQNILPGIAMVVSAYI
jgi:hypothetical protein